MAGSCTCQSFYQNLLPTGKERLFEVTLRPALTNDNGIFIYTPIVLRVPTPAPALFLAFVEPVAKYIDKNLLKTTKLALKFFIQG